MIYKWLWKKIQSELQGSMSVAQKQWVFACPYYQSSPQHTATSHVLPHRLFHQEAKMLRLMISVLLLMVLLAWIHFFSDASLSESLISPSGAYPSFSLSALNLLFALSLAGARLTPRWEQSECWWQAPSWASPCCCRSPFFGIRNPPQLFTGLAGVIGTLTREPLHLGTISFLVPGADCPTPGEVAALVLSRCLWDVSVDLRGLWLCLKDLSFKSPLTRSQWKRLSLLFPWSGVTTPFLCCADDRRRASAKVFSKLSKLSETSSPSLLPQRPGCLCEVLPSVPELFCTASRLWDFFSGWTKEVPICFLKNAECHFKSSILGALGPTEGLLKKSMFSSAEEQEEGTPRNRKPEEKLHKQTQTHNILDWKHHYTNFPPKQAAAALCFKKKDMTCFKNLLSIFVVSILDLSF